MLNNQMTYYTIYKVTNKINNKFYIGCHKTNDINDNYLGSGTRLRRAIKKYGEVSKMIVKKPNPFANIGN